MVLPACGAKAVRQLRKSEKAKVLCKSEQSYVNQKEEKCEKKIKKSKGVW